MNNKIVSVEKNKKWVVPKSFRLLFGGILSFNVLWWLIAVVFNNKALPNPLDVYAVFPKSMAMGMFDHSWASLRRIFIGVFMAIVIGMAGGILTGMSPKANKLLNPLLYLSYPVPKLALLPVVMILFGIGETTKVVMIVLIIVFQLIISIRDATRNIDKENYYVLSTIGASHTQQIWHVVLPGILPETLSALRVTVGIATSVLFVTETFGTDKGLGFFIVDAWMRIDYLTMYAGIVMLSIIGSLLFILLDITDALFCKWSRLRRVN
ncbi:MAG: ABC transporter permease [Dysgonamonadaceae bacterium]|nr:ABC transporter permease [Dysgonamonadaceae bacterium]MDD4728503.1 ABC transporter permease [Dysgonamonadaceae bacterium]